MPIIEVHQLWSLYVRLEQTILYIYIVRLFPAVLQMFTEHRYRANSEHSDVELCL